MLRAETKPFLVPGAILGELADVVGLRPRRGGRNTLLGDFAADRYRLDCGEQDLPRVRERVPRYADLRLGLVDAAVTAGAERNGGRVMTLNLRHVGVVAREGRLTVLP